MEQLLIPFEKELEELEDYDGNSYLSTLSNTTVEASCDALSFVGSLYQLFVDNGMIKVGDDPDLNQMENLIDAIFGELAAACMLLGTFKDVPHILRDTAKELREKNLPEVPNVVIEGYERLASRIEATTRTLLEVKEPKEEVTK